MDPKPKPFDITTDPPANPAAGSPLWLLGSHDAAEYEDRVLIMRHAPELLHELRACYEILLRVLDHQRDGVPLPSQIAIRRTCQDVLNVVGLAEGTITEGTWRYPPQDG
jgi:hypothetical protein